MTGSILTTLTLFMEGSIAIALIGAFLWGVASILLSPCHLGSIPLMVGYITRQNNAGVKEGAILSIIFSLGIFTVLTVTGVLTAVSGRMIGDIGTPLSVALAVLFIFVGVYITGLLPFLDFGRNISRIKIIYGYKGAFILGIIFGAGLGPCAFAFMIPVLSVAFAKAHTAPVFSISLVLLYALGHCILIAIAGMSAGAVSKFLAYNEKSSALKLLRILCGVLVIGSGVYLLIKLFSGVS